MQIGQCDSGFAGGEFFEPPSDGNGSLSWQMGLDDFRIWTAEAVPLPERLCARGTVQRRMPSPRARPLRQFGGTDAIPPGP